MALTNTFLISSCGGNSSSGTNNPTDANVIDNSMDTPDEPTEPKVTYEVPESDFEGYVFRVVDRRDATFGWWETLDMYAEEETGEPLNDAVYNRNRLLESKFNITIQEISKEGGDIPTFVQKSVQAGSDDFDVFYCTMQQAASLLQKGIQTDLYEVPYLNFEKPWWDSFVNDAMTVGGKLYFAAGDISTITNDATWCIMFNKDLNQSMGFDDPYAVVNEGKWTLDVLHENCKKVTKDLNGDGVFVPEDQWGAVNQHECAYALFASTGQRMIEKDTEDFPYLALNNERTINVLNKVITFLSDDRAQVKADDYDGKYTNVWDEVNVKTFSEGRALYYISPIASVIRMRNMADNFGILPLPKYDETQLQYYSPLQYNNATVMNIPKSASDTTRTGIILEAWAAESVDTITKAYYDINLTGKFTRDEESSEMLDLIFANRIIDQGILFNWSGAQDFFINFSKKKTVDFTSQYEKTEKKWITAIEKTIEAILKQSE